MAERWSKLISVIFIFLAKMTFFCVGIVLKVVVTVAERWSKNVLAKMTFF